jgi:hypothetical protein
MMLTTRSLLKVFILNLLFYLLSCLALKKVVEDQKKDIEGMVYDKASGRFVEKPRELVEFDLKNGNAKAKMDTEISMLR